MKEYILENSTIEVKVIPELGGRVDSVVYKPTEKNWVWKNKQLANEKVSKHADYDSNWQGGWEELFPNDAIEKFSWGQGLDHGELWSSSWDIVDYNKEKIHLKVSNLESITLFEKIIELKNNKLICNYKSDVTFDDFFLFKLHLAIPIEDKIVLECNYDNVEKVDKNFGNIIDQQHSFLSLEKDSGLFDFYYLNLKNKSVKLTDGSNNTLELYYGNENLDYFWLFQTQGGWMNHNVLVLEPASNSKKKIHEAASEGNSLKGPLAFKCYYEVELN